MKGYKLWDSENKKIVLSKHVTFNETSLLKFIISQHVERLKTKDVSPRVEINATPPSSVDSVSLGSHWMSPGRDHVAVMDTKQVELVAAKRTNLNPRRWVKKRESRIGELDKLKLKVVVLHDGVGK